jgi:hypothetical protein
LEEERIILFNIKSCSMRLKQLAGVMITAVAFYSCSQKENTEARSEKENDDSEWVEMDSFHLIMAEAFHPYKDSANLEPVKRLSEELAQHAESWASATLPDKVNNDAVKAQLNQLKADTRALSTMIQSGATDEEIGTSLQALHDSFHRIMESWNGGNHEHQH